MDTVVITGVAPSAPLTFTTDPKIPRQPLPASDGTDYLKTIPGFSAIRNGGTNGDPVLRGMFGSRLNLLTNGASMPGACPARMDAPSSYISPENFDQLTVIKGPQTVLWGPGASARGKLAQVGTSATCEVGKFRHVRSVYGCEEMVGNVSEWTYPMPPKSAVGAFPPAGVMPPLPKLVDMYAVVRGACYLRTSAMSMRSSHPRNLSQTRRNKWVGFRPACLLPVRPA